MWLMFLYSSPFLISGVLFYSFSVLFILLFPIFPFLSYSFNTNPPPPHKNTNIVLTMVKSSSSLSTFNVLIFAHCNEKLLYYHVWGRKDINLITHTILTKLNEVLYYIMHYTMIFLYSNI